MDYPGWELRRQRDALAALLLGGGTAEGVEISTEERRAASGDDGGGRPAESGRRAGQRAGQYAGENESGALKIRDMVWTARQDHVRRIREPAAPVSAWEEILSVESASGILAPEGWSGKESAPAGLRQEAGETEFPNGGTVETLEEEIEEYMTQGAARTAERRMKSALGADAGEASAGVKGCEAAGEPSAITRPGGDESAGSNAAGKRMGQTGEFIRRGAGTADNPGRNRTAVSGTLKDGGGAGTWGAWEAAGTSGAEDGARALSRAVQRDARRYDGGFIIY